MNSFSRTIIKIKSFLASFIKSEQIISIYENKSNKIDTIKYYQDAGIPSEDITHEKLGQSTLIFTNRKVTVENDKEVQAAKAEDALGASLRYLKYQRWQNKA